MKIAIVGLGLIGGSIAATIKKKIHHAKIGGWDTNRSSLRSALRAKIIDHAAVTITDVIRGAELIIIATPIDSYADILRAIKPDLKKAQIITDVASSKKKPLAIARRFLKKSLPQFVPGHPLAGSEKSGIGAASNKLLVNKAVILTPLKSTKVTASRKVKNFWQLLGCKVATMTARQHDLFLALTSHLPHVLAYTFINAIASERQKKELVKAKGNSFDDFARIAHSDARLWGGICFANAQAILSAIDKFMDNLAVLKQALRQNRPDDLVKLFQHAGSFLAEHGGKC